MTWHCATSCPAPTGRVAIRARDCWARDGFRCWAPLTLPGGYAGRSRQPASRYGPADGSPHLAAKPVEETGISVEGTGKSVDDTPNRENTSKMLAETLAPHANRGVELSLPNPFAEAGIGQTRRSRRRVRLPHWPGDGARWDRKVSSVDRASHTDQPEGLLMLIPSGAPHLISAPADGVSDGAALEAVLGACPAS